MVWYYRQERYWSNLRNGANLDNCLLTCHPEVFITAVVNVLDSTPLVASITMEHMDGMLHALNVVALSCKIRRPPVGAPDRRMMFRLVLFCLVFFPFRRPATARSYSVCFSLLGAAVFFFQFSLFFPVSAFSAHARGQCSMGQFRAAQSSLEQFRAVQSSLEQSRAFI